MVEVECPECGTEETVGCGEQDIKEERVIVFCNPESHEAHKMYLPERAREIRDG